MQLITSLSFNGQCRQAFEFYAHVLDGEITASFPYGEGGPDMKIDPKYNDWLMHCWLQIGDQAIMGADMWAEFAPNIEKPRNGFDVAWHGKDVVEAGRVFDALSEGGKIGMAFAETFWSPGFGSLTDKFGIPWMVNTIPATT